MEVILETLGKIGFEWRLGLFNLINFLILYAILKKFLFGPVIATINERKQKAEEAIDNFKKAQTELSMAEQKGNKIIEDARRESNEIVATAHKTASAKNEKMKEKAKDEIELLVNQARKNIAIEKRQMKEDVKSELAHFVVMGVEKILEEKVDSKKDKELIDSRIAKT